MAPGIQGSQELARTISSSFRCSLVIGRSESPRFASLSFSGGTGRGGVPLALWSYGLPIAALSLLWDVLHPGEIWGGRGKVSERATAPQTNASLSAGREGRGFESLPLSGKICQQTKQCSHTQNRTHSLSIRS